MTVVPHTGNDEGTGQPEPWDLLVVGGGTAGILAARTAAGFGARALLVERDRTGGECLWSGCVPSKALIAAGDAAAVSRRGSELGVHSEQIRVDFVEVMAHVKSAMYTIEPDDAPEALAAAGVVVRHGTACFTGPTSAVIDGAPVAFRHAVIATGSEPSLPPIEGLLDAMPLTNETIWDLGELPRRLTVLGAGSIGCELGQAFARLGSQVTLVEAGARVLPREDPDASDVIAGALRHDGVTLCVGAKVTAVTPGDVQLADGTNVEFDRLLVATGRRPRTYDLGLDSAGVTTDARGYVQVDTHLRTSNRRIWAAGDVTGNPQFTHTAGVHGSVAASNAILGLRRRADVALQPRVTFTQPEVAAVGVPAEHGDQHGLTAFTVGNEHVDRAVTDGSTVGFTRLLVDGKGRLVGATVVGPRAGEVLGELTLAVRLGLRARDLAATTHPYPTYSFGAWDATIEDVKARLRRPATVWLLRLAVAARRFFVSRRR